MTRTLAMPDALIERAEAEARRQGLTLEEWAEITLINALTGQSGAFPAFVSKAPGSLRLGNDDVRRMEDEDDLRKAGRLG